VSETEDTENAEEMLLDNPLGNSYLEDLGLEDNIRLK
jgi:hypothetical protein